VNNPPLLLIHGMWADRAHWNRYRRFFERAGYDTSAVTLRYHSVPQNLAGLARTGIMDYVDQVRAQVARLTQPPVVIGHSMGGLVAQKLAELEPLRALVLISPCAPGGVWCITPSVIGCAGGNLLDAVLKRPFIIPPRNARYGLMNTLSAREQTVIQQSFLHESGRVLWQILVGAVRVDERKVRCPVLVLVGSADHATPPVVARRIARNYGADYREYPVRCHILSAASDVMQDVGEWVEQKVRQ